MFYNTTPVWISSPTPNVKTSIDDQCHRQECNDGVMKIIGGNKRRPVTEGHAHPLMATPLSMTIYKSNDLLILRKWAWRSLIFVP